MYGAHSTGSAQAVGQDEVKPNTRGGLEIVWDEKLSARLAELWKENSAGAIVKILRSEGHHFTRSAVMGRINRMKLYGKKERGEQRLKPKKLDCNTHNAGLQVQAINRANKADGPPVKAESFTPRTAGVGSCGKTIVDVGFTTECHYPYENQNADGEFTFCGHPVTVGSSQ